MWLDRAVPVVIAILVELAYGCRESPAELSPVSLDAAAVTSQPSALSGPSSPLQGGATGAGAQRRTGVVGMIFHAAHDQKLAHEQAGALESIDASLGAADDGVKRALHTLEVHVAAAIRAGKVDPKAIAPDYAALDAATKDRDEKQAAALGALRGLLTPAQRADLVLAVRARRAAHSLRPPGAPDEDVDDWTQQRLDRLTETVGLDGGQQKKVAALLAKSALPRAQELKARKDVEKARGDALLRAFQVDELFDARALDAGRISERSGEDLIEREDVFLGQLVGVLTPAQREKLAASREAPGPAGDLREPAP
ncbi:MAG: hypothetical protein ACRENE_26730 [Polyangiaceae bacterium]